MGNKKNGRKVEVLFVRDVNLACEFRLCGAILARGLEARVHLKRLLNEPVSLVQELLLRRLLLNINTLS